jgi:hypothetical protein
MDRQFISSFEVAGDFRATTKEIKEVAEITYVLFPCTLFRVSGVVSLQFGNVPLPPSNNSVSSLSLVSKLVPGFVSNNVVKLSIRDLRSFLNFGSRWI